MLCNFCKRESLGADLAESAYYGCCHDREVPMKDLHWIFIFAAILITPFLPAMIRGKCPGCGKRKLQSLDTLKLHADSDSSPFTYITLYRCDSCDSLFKRTKSGSLEQSTTDEHNMIQEAAVQ
jgi:hypothetical protein